MTPSHNNLAGGEPRAPRQTHEVAQDADGWWVVKHITTQRTIATYVRKSTAVWLFNHYYRRD